MAVYCHYIDRAIYCPFTQYQYSATYYPSNINIENLIDLYPWMKTSTRIKEEQELIQIKDYPNQIRILEQKRGQQHDRH